MCLLTRPQSQIIFLIVLLITILKGYEACINFMLLFIYIIIWLNIYSFAFFCDFRRKRILNVTTSRVRSFSSRHVKRIEQPKVGRYIRMENNIDNKRQDRSVCNNIMTTLDTTIMSKRVRFLIR